MATNLVGNEKLQRFIELLSKLNGQSVQMLKTGDVRILQIMNDVVEEMYAIQSQGTEDAFTAIDEQMNMIRQNFNAVVTVLQSRESDDLDKTTGNAVHKFVRNIFDATVQIVHAYGLA